MKSPPRVTTNVMHNDKTPAGITSTMPQFAQETVDDVLVSSITNNFSPLHQTLVQLIESPGANLSPKTYNFLQQLFTFMTIQLQNQTVWPRHCLVQCLVSGKWSGAWSRHWCRHKRVTRGECVTNYLELITTCVTTWLPSFPPDVAPITTIHMCDKQHSYQVFQTLSSKLTFPLCPVTLHTNTKPC